MIKKMYPLPFWNELKVAILKAKTSLDGPHYAAFDADGTLWDFDAGENFFEHEIEKKLVDLPENAFEHYLEMKKEDKKKAFLWLAQIHKGKTIDEVRRWSQEATDQIKNFPFIKAQKELVHFLNVNYIEVFIVTASVRWAVEPAAKFFDIDEDHIIGVTTKVENGIVTDVQDGPVTFGSGKPEALLERMNGVQPILSAGNTMGDVPLLECSRGVSLAVKAVKEDHKLFETESALQAEASKNGWFHFDFQS